MCGIGTHGGYHTPGPIIIVGGDWLIHGRPYVTAAIHLRASHYKRQAKNTHIHSPLGAHVPDPAQELVIFASCIVPMHLITFRRSLNLWYGLPWISQSPPIPHPPYIPNPPYTPPTLQESSLRLIGVPRELFCSTRMTSLEVFDMHFVAVVTINQYLVIYIYIYIADTAYPNQLQSKLIETNRN